MQTNFKAMDNDHPRVQVETFQRTLFTYHLDLGQDREHQAEVSLESMVGHCLLLLCNPPSLPLNGKDWGEEQKWLNRIC